MMLGRNVNDEIGEARRAAYRGLCWRWRLGPSVYDTCRGRETCLAGLTSALYILKQRVRVEVSV